MSKKYRTKVKQKKQRMANSVSASIIYFVQYRKSGEMYRDGMDI